MGHNGSAAGKSGGRGGSGFGGSGSYAQLPATFTITAGGGLDPTAVSLPAVRAVKFSIVSRDGRTHHVLLRMTAGPRGLTVAGHHRATLVLRGVAPGRYVIDVDGLARGVVLVERTPAAR